MSKISTFINYALAAMWKEGQKMSFLLRKLETKKDIDIAIKTTIDKVLVLRFGRESDAVCLQLDDVVQNLPINIPANPMYN